MKAKAGMPIGSMSIQCKHRDKRDKDCIIHLMYTSNQSERVHTCPILVALYIHYNKYNTFDVNTFCDRGQKQSKRG